MFNKLKEIIKLLMNHQFIRFALVGGLGTVTNLVVFYIMADIVRLNYNVTSVISFLIAVTQNFLLNHSWSFEMQEPMNLRTYISFVAVCLIGLAVNIAVLNFIVIVFKPVLKVIGQLFGILVGLFANYFGSKLFVFRKRNEKT